MSTTIECNETCCEVIAALQTALQEATDALAIRNKQLGVACMKHDLVHALGCGICLKEAERKLTDMRGTVADFMDKNDALADKLTEAQTLAAATKGAGMVCVPREPTEAMIERTNIDIDMFGMFSDADKAIVVQIYKAMLSAAAEGGGDDE